MRRYESVWVVQGDLPDEEVKATIDKFSRIITSNEGILVGLDDWGRRRLSYKIKGSARGYYVVADFAGTPATVKELERNFRIDDHIIRYQTSKKSDKVNLEALEAEKAAKAKASAPAAPAAAAAAPEAETAAMPAEETPAAPAGEAVETVAPLSEAKED